MDENQKHLLEKSRQCLKGSKWSTWRSIRYIRASFRRRSAPIVDGTHHKNVLLVGMEEREGRGAERPSWIFVGGSSACPTRMAPLGLHQRRCRRTAHVFGILSQISIQNVDSNIFCQDGAVELVSSAPSLLEG